MIMGQKVEVEQGGNIHNGRVTKVLNTGNCIVSWRYKRGRDIYEYSVFYEKEEAGKGRVKYENKSFK